MKIIKPYSVLIYIILFFLLDSCKQKHEYFIYGRVEHLVTKEPLEGVKVGAVRGIYDFGGRTGTKEFATSTDANGEFQLSFSSREFEFFELTYNKEDYNSYAGRQGTRITESTGDVGLLKMFLPPEFYTLKFRALNTNTKEVTIHAEWDRFLQEENIERTMLQSYPPNFDLDYGSGHDLIVVKIGEQWLKLDFDILLNDGTRTQKTDSIWFPANNHEGPKTNYLIEY